MTRSERAAYCLLQYPTPVDDKIDAVNTSIVEQEFHGIDDVLGGCQSSTGRTRACGR